jgi:ABC-type nitrate/sulfonate/bicarbonate transport system permease component
VSKTTGALDANETVTATVPSAETPQPRRKAVYTGRKDYTGGQRMLIGALSVLTFFALWELTTRIFEVNALFLPELSAIWGSLVRSYESGLLLPNLRISVNLFFWSMLLSLAIAIPLGILVGAVDVLNRTFTTWLWAIYTSPRIVFLPLILLWFGITTTAKVIIIVISAVPPATVIIVEGVKTVESSLLRVGRSYGATRQQTLRKIVLPATLPYIGTGVRMGVSRGLVGLFGAELFTAHNGLGFLLMQASKRYDVALVFGILGIYLSFCMLAVAASNSLERRLGRWRE